MSSVRILIGGREYQVACDDGEEGRLKSLARLLDERVRSMGGGSGRINESQVMMLAGLMLTDELEDAKREVDRVKSEARTAPAITDKQKQLEMEGVIAATLHDIAARVEAITTELERAS